MSDNIKKSIGNIGEKAVCAYLEKRGYTIVARNFFSRYGEIDIIASGGKYLVFTEVKTRSENPMYPPSQAVTKAKQRKIIKTAYAYIMKNKSDLQPRFDVAEVIIKKRTSSVSINYIKNAFILEDDYAAF